MKHIYFLFISFLLITSNIMAQDVKTATYKNGNVFKSFQYYLNDFNDTIYHGKYVDSIYKVVSNKYPTVFYNTGTYADGKRIGQWEFSFRRLKNEDHLEGYLTKTVQFNNEGRLDGLYEVIESEQYMTKESGRAFRPIFYPFARYSILRDYYSKKYDYHLKINYRDGIQQDFYSEATWYPYEVENGKIKPYAPYITNLSGKFDKNGVATGVWVECYGSEKSTWEAEDSLAILQRYKKVYNPCFVFGDIIVYKDGNFFREGRFSIGKASADGPNDAIDVYYSLDKVQEHYGPGLELFSYEIKIENNLRDTLLLLYKTEGNEAKVESLLDEIKKYNSSSIDRCHKANRFDLNSSCNSTTTLYYDLYKIWQTRDRVLKRYDKFGSIDENYDYPQFLNTFSNERNYQLDVKLLSKYLQVKQDEIKIDTIVQKYNCQNYIDYNTFKSKCNQRWEIIESQTSDNGYYGELEKLYPFVKNTLTKCEKIESFAKVDSVIVNNTIKVKIISKYSLAYQDMFFKLCNEKDAGKQAQYEQEIELLQKKTQEICSVVDTKAFEKQIKSASDVEQIKTLIINYK